MTCHSGARLPDSETSSDLSFLPLTGQAWPRPPAATEPATSQYARRAAVRNHASGPLGRDHHVAPAGHFSIRRASLQPGLGTCDIEGRPEGRPFGKLTDA